MNDPGATNGRAPQGVVLWERGPVSCTCLHLAPDNIEIRLCVDNHPLDRKQFSDAESATQYAINKMRSYNAA